MNKSIKMYFLHNITTMCAISVCHSILYSVFQVKMTWQNVLEKGLKCSSVLFLAFKTSTSVLNWITTATGNLPRNVEAVGDSTAVKSCASDWLDTNKEWSLHPDAAAEIHMVLKNTSIECCIQLMFSIRRPNNIHSTSL